MRIIFISLILIFGATACKNKYRKAADEIIGNTKPTNMNVGKEKYSLTIPDGWTTENRNNYGVDYYYVMAPKTIVDPNTSINVANEFMQNLSLEEYLTATIQSVKKAIPSAIILEQGEIVANDLKGCWYSYNMEPQGIKATLIGYIFPKNGVAYIITAGTQTKDAVKYRSTFDNVAKSFKFNQE
jgi:PsbP